MTTKLPPFSRDQLEAISRTYPTPFHIYDEQGIRAAAHRLQQAFAWAPGFREYFAVKATPNPYILKVLRAEDLGVDCSSLAELVLAQRSGFAGEDIMFTSNDTPAQEFQQARALGAIINLDDLSHLPYLAEHAGLPDLLCFRYNPGELRPGNAIIGNPKEAKYGLTRVQLFEGYRRARDQGVRRFGLHTMVASNELDAQYFIDTAVMLFDLVAELSHALDIRFEFVNLGGGIGIPYKPEQSPVDLERVGAGIRAAYEGKIVANDLHPLRLYMECGRVITGPSGYLVTRVLHLKQTYKTFVGVDASMADLMRPGMYGAYHHITVPGKEALSAEQVYDVTGSLCENNDKFAVDRRLPEIAPGDLLVIHDTGAHGHAMGFNYNGKLRSAEPLLRPNNEVVLIRRAETLDDYFATLDFSGLPAFATGSTPAEPVPPPL
jgi:diaminopimelate decarboxylase